jgi:hypothetical protein
MLADLLSGLLYGSFKPAQKEGKQKQCDCKSDGGEVPNHPEHFPAHLHMNPVMLPPLAELGRANVSGLESCRKRKVKAGL